MSTQTVNTIEEARRVIADLAAREGELQFAREVLAGSWDHRNDVQAVVAGTFKPRDFQTNGQAYAKWLREVEATNHHSRMGT